MAIVSKYSTEQVEQLLNDVLKVVDNHNVTTDLALMVLGNAATCMINQRVAPEQRKKLTEGFAKALKNSINDEK
ncbi:UPF0352 protein YejL [Agarivorans sp. OAG1]|jgi:uncharacterized protein YejL (UPF0352 family)|uniref:DUF1414 domain-containing protein n=1 Tax=Agarivorans TaxID=261825 RepID=UPI00058C1940|nr:MULTISPECIES: DUF1414 domain-containing protein [Agarivorans]BEU02983.1 UPF0352 protein YejL [Agarivorans sp. OAG1]